MSLANILYVIVFYILLCLSLLNYDKRNIFSLYLTFTTLLIASLFLGFRSFDSGKDTMGYVKYYAEGFNNFDFEIGYYYISKLLSLFFSPSVYLFTIAFLSLIMLVIASAIWRIKNISLVLIVYIGLLPGLDMLTNTIRNGLALNLSTLLVTLSIHKTNFKFLPFLSVSIHGSTLLTAALRLVTIKRDLYRINLWLLGIAVFALFLFSYINLDVQKLASAYNRGDDIISKLARYIILDKNLLAESVKNYFKIIAVAITLPYIFGIVYSKEIKLDIRLHMLMFIGVSLLLFYSLLSFIEYAFRFMYLSYPILVISAVYCIEKYIRSEIIIIIFYFIIVLLAGVTYSTSTFSSYKLLFLNFAQ
tara:strand:- start:3532 stop:4614 length:1083 start_codon:yes stop_codon:yes gene_type:complete